MNFNLFFYDPIVDAPGKAYIKGREIERNLNVNIELIIFPIIPYWYEKENKILTQYIDAKRYWLYRPKRFPKIGDDFIFGEYEKINYL